jgi:hypothetical protein
LRESEEREERERESRSSVQAASPQGEGGERERGRGRQCFEKKVLVHTSTTSTRQAREGGDSLAVRLREKAKREGRKWERGRKKRKGAGSGEKGCPQALPLVFELLFENDPVSSRGVFPLEKPLGGRLGGGWRDSQGGGVMGKS